jgi:hypothetical protein
MSIPQHRIDWQAYDAFEGTDAAFARSIGLSPNNFAQYKRRRLRHECRAADVPVDGDTTRAAGNGNLPAVSPTAYPSHPERTHVTPISPHGIPAVPYLTDGTLPPTTKHSFVIAVDLLEAIQAFAASHHLQVKDALDLLVRKSLAAHGEGVRADA